MAGRRSSVVLGTKRDRCFGQMLLLQLKKHFTHDPSPESTRLLILLHSLHVSGSGAHFDLQFRIGHLAVVQPRRPMFEGSSGAVGIGLARGSNVLPAQSGVQVCTSFTSDVFEEAFGQILFHLHGIMMH